MCIRDGDGGVIDRRLHEKGVKDERACRYCLDKNGSKFWTRLSGLGRGTKPACLCENVRG